MKEFSCGKCPRQFNEADSLFSHFRQHMTKDFACCLCFKEFSTKSLFDFHRDGVDSSCKNAKAILKKSIEKLQRDDDSKKKLLSILDEFRYGLRFREEMVCSNSLCTQFELKVKCQKMIFFSRIRGVAVMMLIVRMTRATTMLTENSICAIGMK